jgi:predicted O-methyltransferase YrrM
MNVKSFIATFEHFFPKEDLWTVTSLFEDRFVRSFFDPCFTINGMSSIKKQTLLRIAASNLPENECYLEVGTYTGKSLVSALLGDPGCKFYACDNFSLFKDTNSLEILMENLKSYGFQDKVDFFNEDYKNIFHKQRIKEPIGVYFYDGEHDFPSQYDAIRLVEPLLAPTSLVIIDDWRFAEDSNSYAKEATEQAIAESKRSWRLLYDLPARYNGDHATWWNGVAVYETFM